MKTLVEYCKDIFTFEYFAQDSLVYKATDAFLVRVPVKDLDGAAINVHEKGSVLMKWIRKELEGIKETE